MPSLTSVNADTLSRNGRDFLPSNKTHWALSLGPLCSLFCLGLGVWHATTQSWEPNRTGVLHMKKTGLLTKNERNSLRLINDLTPSLTRYKTDDLINRNQTVVYYSQFGHDFKKPN